MRITLPSGKKVKLYFKHNESSEDSNGQMKWKKTRLKLKNGHWEECYINIPFRSTTAFLGLVEEEISPNCKPYETTVNCHSEDEFKKEQGRKLAFRKLLQCYNLHEYFSKEDRRTMWKHVLPRRFAAD